MFSRGGFVCTLLVRTTRSVGPTRRLSPEGENRVKTVQQWGFLIFFHHHVLLDASGSAYVTARDHSWRTIQRRRRRRQTYCASRALGANADYTARRTRPAHTRHVGRTRRDEPRPRYNGGKRAENPQDDDRTPCLSTNSVIVVQTTWNCVFYAVVLDGTRDSNTSVADSRIDSIMCQVGDAGSAWLGEDPGTLDTPTNDSDVIAYPYYFTFKRGRVRRTIFYLEGEH